MAEWKNIYEDENLKIGMWLGSERVYFTYSTPLEDMKELEFMVLIRDLKQVVNNAEMYEKEGGRPLKGRKA